MSTQAQVGNWGKFEKTDVDDGKLAFKSYHNRYMTTKDVPDDLVRVNQLEIDDWARFEFEYQMKIDVGQQFGFVYIDGTVVSFFYYISSKALLYIA